MKNKKAKKFRKKLKENKEIKKKKVKEVEEIKEKKKINAQEKLPQTKQAETFDFQLETVTKAESVPILETKPKPETITQEFNLEEFLQSLQGIEVKKGKKEYVSKPEYSVAHYVEDSNIEKKYVDAAREWREAMVTNTEQVNELFPRLQRRVRLREETIDSSRMEVERLSPQETLEYDHKLRFEEKGSWHKKEKRIKKYEIFK